MESDILFSQEQHIFKKNTTYKAHIDTSKWPEGTQQEANWVLAISESNVEMSSFHDLSSEGAKLWFNSDELSLGEEGSRFYISNTVFLDDVYCLCGDESRDIAPTDDITIQFQVAEDIPKSYLLFATWG